MASAYIVDENCVEISCPFCPSVCPSCFPSVCHRHYVKRQILLSHI